MWLVNYTSNLYHCRSADVAKATMKRLNSACSFYNFIHWLICSNHFIMFRVVVDPELIPGTHAWGRHSCWIICQTLAEYHEHTFMHSFTSINNLDTQVTFWEMREYWRTRTMGWKCKSRHRECPELRIETAAMERSGRQVNKFSPIVQTL